MPSVRGDVHRLPDNRHATGHVQRGPRYCVVVQSDNLMLSTVVVCPTSTSAQPATWRPEVTILGKDTLVLPEQILTADPQKLGKVVDTIPLGQLLDIDAALKLIMGL